MAIPNVDVRDCSTYECDRDLRTDQMAYQIADELQAATGLRPYLVIAEFDRDYLDANRPSGDAAFAQSTAATAVQVYDYYHAGIQSYVDEIRATFGEGLLIDIHGQSSIADKIFRGTQNGLSVQNLNADAMSGPNSIFGQLSAVVDAGGQPVYDVEPDVTVPYAAQVETTFPGGYVIKTYGSHQVNGIDAIQIEYGYDYRRTSGSPATWIQTSNRLGGCDRKLCERVSCSRTVTAATLLGLHGFVLPRNETQVVKQHRYTVMIRRVKCSHQNAPKGHNIPAQGRAKRRPGCVPSTQYIANRVRDTSREMFASNRPEGA